MSTLPSSHRHFPVLWASGSLEHDSSTHPPLPLCMRCSHWQLLLDYLPLEKDKWAARMEQQR